MYPQTMIDRLTLTPSRISQMAEGVRQVASIESPVGSVIETITRPNGLVIEKEQCLLVLLALYLKLVQM